MRALARHLLIALVVLLAPAALVPALAAAGPVAPFDGSPLPDATASIAAAPANTATPAIGGAIRTGQVLTVSLGTWTGSPTSFAYQWQLDSGSGFADIPGAISSSYTPAPGDSGAQLRAQITATNASGSTPATSPEVGPVDAAVPTNTVAPRVTGTAKRGATLVVSTGSWNPAGTSYAYQWQSDDGSGFADISGATTTTYSPVAGDVGAPLRVEVTATNAEGSTPADSAPTAAVVASPPVNTALPAISGTAKRTFTLTASTGTWSPAGSTFAYQWQRDSGSGFQDISGATASTYALTTGDVGGRVRVEVTATNPDADTVAVSPQSAVVQTAAPAPVTAPLLTGTARVGATLTGSNGTWLPAATSYAYQWQRDSGSGFADITGATTSTYRLDDDDFATRIRVKVTATNADGSAVSMSGPSAVVVTPPVATVDPDVPSGTLLDTSVLTADPGTWTPATALLSYQWLRCPATATAVTASCMTVGSGPTYRLAAEDVGRPMAVRVTAASPGGATAATSPLTDVVEGRPLVNVTAPAIAGTVQVAETVHAQAGTWNVPTHSVHLQWLRCDADGSNCAAIPGATYPQYAVGLPDEGHQIALREDATSPGQAESAASDPVTVADQPLPVASAPPTVAGTTARTQFLRATPGVWTNKPARIAFQWQRCDADGTDCADISGAHTSSYGLTGADVGHAMTVAVTATNTAGSATASAAPSGVVAPVLPVLRTAPAVSGTLQVPRIVQSVRSSWQATPDTRYTYQWRRCDEDGANCEDITAARTATYKLASADADHTLRVAQTATNVDGAVTAQSAPSGLIKPAPPGVVTYPRLVIDASPVQVGRSVTFTAGTWTPGVDTKVTQFWRCNPRCAVVATDDTAYTLVGDDAGALIRASETATGPGGVTVAYAKTTFGPVRSVSVATAVAAVGASATLRTSGGAALATATVGRTAATASAAALAAKPKTVSIAVRRRAGARGSLRAWACITPVRATDTKPCTPARALARRTTLKLSLPSGRRVQLVVARKRR